MRSFRRICSMILSLGMGFSMAIPLVACKGNKDHAHAYSKQWSMDSNSHWYSAVCEHGELITGINAHDFTVESVNPTCTESGYSKYTCKTCNYSYTGNAVEAKGHTFSEEWRKNKDRHWRVATCEHTSEITGDESHNFSVKIVAATCAAVGYKKYACMTCDYSYSNEFEATGIHVYEERVVAPTCTEDGYTVHSCKMCDASFTDGVVSATGHSFAATWSGNDAGHKKTATCGHASAEQSLPHNYVYDSASGDVRCSDCNYAKTVSAGLEFTALSDGNYSVSKGTVAETDYVVIPRTHNGKLVTEIGSSAFSYVKWLKRIVLPDTITKIGSSAFNTATALEEIVLPNGIREIQSGAFEGAKSLKKINLPESITTIAGRAFHSTAIEEVVIPSSITVIGVSTFYNCAKLKKVTLPDGLKEIQSEAFHKCPLLGTEQGGAVYVGTKDNPYFALIRAKDTAITECTIAEGCVLLYDQAFLNCKELTQVTFPTSLKTIGGRVFVGCSKLTDYYYLGTRAQWNGVTVGTYNPSLTATTVTGHYADDPPAA